LGDVRNPIVGVVEGPFVADAETITPNTGLLVVTDGITEATSPGDELFGFERLKSLMRSMEMRSAQHMIQTTTEAADRFRESRAQLDDVTVFALLKSSAHD
jgi:serine phosphatase RsbU (regulator of sigma subunit)